MQTYISANQHTQIIYYHAHRQKQSIIDSPTPVAPFKREAVTHFLCKSCSTLHLYLDEIKMRNDNNTTTTTNRHYIFKNDLKVKINNT